MLYILCGLSYKNIVAIVQNIGRVGDVRFCTGCRFSKTKFCVIFAGVDYAEYAPCGLCAVLMDGDYIE